MFKRLSVQRFDRPCKKCGTLIFFSKGQGDCRRCTGLENEELIDLHIQQAGEVEYKRKLGQIFFSLLGLTLIATVLYIVF